MTTLDELRDHGVASFATHEDRQFGEPLSPGTMFGGDTSFNSDLAMSMNGDDASPMESERDERDFGDELLQPYQSSYTSRKGHSRRQSATTNYSFVSAMPSEAGSMSSKPVAAGNLPIDTRYAPRAERPRFRNPESVRAMQMSSPAPMSPYESNRERMKNTYGLATPGRTGRCETPVSRHSGSRRGSIRSHHSPKPQPAPQQAPLVLLHVTILPMQLPFSHDHMARLMPQWLAENFRLLEEKLQDIILMRRGLLIPHPRDEYELLEERILESLELKTPRLLKCGHFVSPDEDTEDGDSAIGADDAANRMSGATGSNDHEGIHSRRDSAMCFDCHRELKKPGQGVGAGTRRFDIRIYAANGLMRSEAWTAAWTEMERCDVEITPWIPEEVRKTLEKRVLEEQEADKRKAAYNAELQRKIQEDAVRQQKLAAEAIAKKRQDEEELQRSFEAATAALQRSIEESAADKVSFEETLEQKLEEAKEAIRFEVESQAMMESNSVAERFRAMEESLRQYQYLSCPQSPLPPSQASSRSRASTYDIDLRSVSRGRRGYTSTRPHAAQIPLSTLLKNYVLVQLADPKNWAIVLLTVAVGLMSMNMGSQQPTTPLISDVLSVDMYSASAVTATTTAFSTLTVTEIQMASSIYPTPSYYSSSYATPSSSVAPSALPTIIAPSTDIIADPHEAPVFESSSTVDDEPLRRDSETSEADPEETVVAEDPVVEDLTEPANMDANLFQHTSELLGAVHEDDIVMEDPVTPQAEDSASETESIADSESGSVAIESDDEMEVCPIEYVLDSDSDTCSLDGR
ncbi:hypothetical protein C7974DRAFT_384130 [Boeremia exigua]|uniref:uncharacterized protein n=1 Tax=Boeremia exigua TaxID=749465 RepID=UPI001E8EC608|nr:uncharacterized protein C7974DRAFT_384130 [Boeremia exigua]KAH6644706.1 hypothetical protein C7974DRAFT_384130 [Boeremia exigua]